MSKLLRIGGSIVLVGFLAYRLDWPRVFQVFRGLNPWLWLAALGLQLATQVTSAWRWRMFAQPLGLGGRFRDYLSYYFVGMFFNLVLPTSVGGDVVRAWYLAKRPGPGHGRKMSAVLSVLADRVSGVVLLATVACLAAAFCPAELPAWVRGVVAGVGVSAVAGVVGLPLVNRILHSPALSFRHLHQFRRLTAGGVAYLRDVRLVAATTALSLVVQVNCVIVMALVGVGLGLKVHPMYYGVVMPLMSLLTLLPVSVNGMGLREWSTVVLLAPLGVGSSEAVALAFLVFTVQSAAGLTGLIPYLAGGMPRFDARSAAARGEDEKEEAPEEAEAAA